MWNLCASFEYLFKGVKVASKMSMWTTLDLYRSSYTTKAVEDKALATARKWKAIMKKACEDAKVLAGLG